MQNLQEGKKAGKEKAFKLTEQLIAAKELLAIKQSRSESWSR
jgi:hypothetical protein